MLLFLHWAIARRARWPEADAAEDVHRAARQCYHEPVEAGGEAAGAAAERRMEERTYWLLSSNLHEELL